MLKLSHWLLRRNHCYYQPCALLWTDAQQPMEAENCISVIKQCWSLRSLKSVHASMLRSQLVQNIYFITNLIAQYATLGSVSLAYSLFSAFRSSDDVFLWNVMIRGLVDNAHYHHSLLLYSQMLKLGIAPDNFTFPFVLKACGCLSNAQIGAQVHEDVLLSGYESDVIVANSLITMYGKCERYELCRQVFDEMPNRNVVSWSAIIGACLQNELYEEGVLLFWEMLRERIRPSRGSVLNVMACVFREDEADYVCRVVRDSGLDLDQSVQTGEIRMYARCGRMDTARRLFDGILNKDLVMWASMIEAYAQGDLPLEAFYLFKQMMLQRITPDSVTLLSVIRACSILASFQPARAVHGMIIRSFFSNQIAIETAVVDLYAKCSSLAYARRVFDRMQDRNIISWSTMISGYGMHGHGKEALNIFDQMKISVKPDHVAFVSILSACSHAGLVAEGWECFRSMVRDFGVTPRPEHYACMVDLLGRAGKLQEACNFIEKMPIKPNAGVWGSLLGACKIHSNVDLAEIAAKSLLGLDAENSGRYVLLSNIYASSGREKEADRIRMLMKNRGVRKIAGHTIIEIKNKVYTFVGGDRSHTQTDTSNHILP